MSHNIHKNTDGTDAFLGVRLPAWHKLGDIIPAGIPVIQAAERIQALYEVEKVEDLYLAKDGSLKSLPTPAFYTIRTDTDTPLGRVGSDYTVMNNRPIFESLEAIAGNIVVETIGVLGKGERVFATCKLPENFKIAGDEYKGYFVVTNSHDGTGKARWFITPIRTVCQNTLNAGIDAAKRSMGISHHKNWEQKLVEVRNNLELTQVYYTKFADVMNGLSLVKYTEKNFSDLMDQLFAQPADDATSRAKTIYEQTRDNMLTAYNATDLNNIRDTKLGAYNAIADYADHYTIGQRGENKDTNAYLRTFTNTTLKDKAFELILKA